MTWLLVPILLLALTTGGAVSTKDSWMFNGRPASYGTYPWAGSLMLRTAEEHRCSVTIITPRWLVTPAHCVPLEAHFYRVSLGQGIHTFYHIDQIVKHDGFSKNGTEYENDIAMIHTDREIQFNSHTHSARLPDHPIPIDMNCWAIGQGVQYDETAKYVTVGTSDLSDGPYADAVLTHESWRYIILDPLMTIPVNGTIIHWDIYVKVPNIGPDGVFYLCIFRKMGPGNKYTWGCTGVDPKTAGPQRINVTTSVMQGDTIGIQYSKGRLARIAYKQRVNCEAATLNYSSSYGSGYLYSAYNDYPCRDYAIRATIKVNPSVSGMAPRLQEIKVTVQTSDSDKIIVAGHNAVPCEGDDGGSLSCNCGGISTVYGYYTYGSGKCNAENSNAVYIQLFHYLEWMKNIIDPQH